MDRVTPGEVIECIESLLAANSIQALSKAGQRAATRAVRRSIKQSSFDQHNIHPLNSLAQAERFISGIKPYPARRFEGRGIVICAGGATYFANAWVCINMLRMHRCHLPIELWHLGRGEFDTRMEALVAPLGVRCVNARETMDRHPMRNPLGWELKSYAIVHSRFEEVLFLDADNVPVSNPEFLFDSPEYHSSGAIFWPDYQRLGRNRPVWKLCGGR
jgi:hypothetical protein